MDPPRGRTDVARGGIDREHGAVPTAPGVIGACGPAPGSSESTRPVWRVLHAAWAFVCLSLFVVLIATRWLRYSSWSAIPPLDRLMPRLMILDAQAFVWPWVYSTLKLRIVLLALAVLGIGLHRRLIAQFVGRVDGVWRLTPTAVSTLLGTMLWLHYFFDLNSQVALACASSLLLVSLLEDPRVAAILPVPATAVVGSIYLAGWIVAARDPIDRLAIGAWMLLTLLTDRYLRPRMPRRDLALLRVLAIMPVNLLSAALPLVLPWHGGTRLGPGLAYAFCEVPNRGTVYATIPVCDSVNARYEDCRDGAVVEYDPKTLQHVASHRYFSPDFHGRLELMECLDDEVQVAIQAAVIRGNPVVQTALAFPVAAPTIFNPMVAGPGIGITIAYDRAHEALFYTSEYSHRIARADRRTQQLTEVGGDVLARRWYQPVLLDEHTGSSILYTHSIHPGRNRIYTAEWMRGRYAYAIDLESLRVVARYDVGGGGALGITVDPGRDRLLVSSVWGLDVFDLRNDALLTRRRLGFGNRSVVLDEQRNLLYVPSTVEGKIHILDRDSFDVVGQIPIGIGVRFPYLSLDGQQLFASSDAAHFVWETRTLDHRR